MRRIDGNTRWQVVLCNMIGKIVNRPLLAKAASSLIWNAMAKRKLRIAVDGQCKNRLRGPYNVSGRRCGWPC